MYVILLFFCFFFNLYSSEIVQEEEPKYQEITEEHKRVPLYTLYTESHKILFEEWFLPSIRDDFNIIVLELPQECLTARFKEKGWIKTTTKKVEMIIRAVEETMGSWFVYSDVDVQFFAPIQDELFECLRDVDFVVQRENPAGIACSGFFACKSNERTLRLWQEALNYMNTHANVSDQSALNYALRHMDADWAITWKLLPITYFGPGTIEEKSWTPNHCLIVPEGAKMHHANWTKGVGNKLEQLAYVWRIMRRRQPSDVSTSLVGLVESRGQLLIKTYQKMSKKA